MAPAPPPTQEDVGKEPTKDDLAEGVPVRFLVKIESTADVAKRVSSVR